MTTLDRDALEVERDAVLDRLQQLEREHASGALTEAEYIDLRDEQTAQAARILTELSSANANFSELDENEYAEGTYSHPVRKKASIRRKKLVAALAAFVVLTAGALAAAVHQRSSGDQITGTIGQNTNTLLQKAQADTGKGDAVNAVKVYAQVLKIDPNNVQALTYQGWLIYLAGLPNEGQQSIQKAIAIQPSYPDAHFFNGYILLRVRNDPKGAIAEFQTFLADNPPKDMVSLVQQALQDAQALAAKPG